MTLQSLTFVLLGLFLLVDLLACLLIKPSGQPTPNTMDHVLNFFIGINTRVVAILHAVLTEVEKNWQEYGILAVIYYLMAGLSLVVYFGYALIGYLLFRVTFDK